VSGKSDSGTAPVKALENGPSSHSEVRLIEMETTLASLRSALEIVRLGDRQAREVNLHLQELASQLKALSHSHQDASQSAFGETAARIRPPPGVTTQKNQLVYCSAAMREVVAMASRAAASGVITLITGETGVGKELIARLIHLRGARSGALLVPFNCAALPKDLFESFFFGHKRGSFTGATRDQGGVIRAAAGGTLFLDEIGELPLDVQPKLLRFLQEGEIHPVGQACPIRIDTRVIASTNRRLQSDVLAGRFRADLFYRLNVLVINLPPLRERRDDILVLCDHFIEKYAFGRAIQLSPGAKACLMEYDWPGNVRELSNIVQRLCAMADDGQAPSGADVRRELSSPMEVSQLLPRAGDQILRPGVSIPPGLTLSEAVGMLERQHVLDTLTRHGGNFARAARDLGLSTFGLRKKHLRLFATGAKQATPRNIHQPE